MLSVARQGVTKFMLSRHRRSQGVHPAPSRAVKKFWRNLKGNFVTAPPAHQVHP